MKKLWAWALTGTMALSLAAPWQGAEAAVSVTLSKERIVLEEEGDRATITATISGADDADAVVSWSIDDDDIISISPKSGKNKVTIEGEDIGIAELRATYSGYRDEVVVVVQGSVEDDPGDTAPAEFKGTSVDSETIRWTWEDLSNDEDGFIIYDEDGEEVGRVDEDETEWEEDGLAPDKKYTRYVRAYKDDELSSKSDEATVRTMDEDEEEASSEVSRADVLEGLEDAYDVDPGSPKIKMVKAEDLEDVAEYEVELSENMVIVFPYESMDDYEGDRIYFENNDIAVKMDASELKAIKDETAYAFWYSTVEPESQWDEDQLLSPVVNLRVARIESDGDGANIDDASATLEFVFDERGSAIDLWHYSEDSKEWQKIKSNLYDRGGFVVVTVNELGQYFIAKAGFNPDGQTTYEPEPEPVQDPEPQDEIIDYVEFTDVSGHWAEGVIEEMASKGLVKGRGDGTFDPDATLTRAEFVTLLYQVLNLGAPSDEVALPFNDVASSDWFYEKIASAYKEGILPWGMTNFRPDEGIRREDAIAWLGRAALLKGIKPVIDNPRIPKDWSKVTAALKNDITYALRTGLIQGRPDGNLDPAATLTRAEGAVIVKGLSK